MRRTRVYARNPSSASCGWWYRCSYLCLPEVPRSERPTPRPGHARITTAQWRCGCTRDEGRDPGDRRRRSDRRGAPGPGQRPGHRAGPRVHAVVAAARGVADRHPPGVQRMAGVVAFDFRGHGRSGGLCTMGDKEIRDLDVAVGYARELGYPRVAAIGFSMGASIVLRYAGLIGGGLDAVASVSSPGWWYFRGTERMRRVHFAVEHRLGRLATRKLAHTRVTSEPWDPVPVPPDQAAARIAGIPLLVVHGDQDPYFPVEHAQHIFRAAHDPKELWLVPGYGHAESACPPALTHPIGGGGGRAGR